MAEAESSAAGGRSRGIAARGLGAAAAAVTANAVLVSESDAAALVLSFVPDLALLAVDPDATVPGVVALMAMHVVVAVSSVAFLTAGRGQP